VERALRIITGRAIRIVGASRTDAGVHARGQVASFLLPDDVAIPTGDLCQALNGNMDADIAARRVEEARLDFHAQRDARGKVYSYSMITGRLRSPLCRRTHWHLRYELDVERMRAAAKALIGTHDFTSFATRLNETQETRAGEGKRPLETVREVRRVELCQDAEHPERLVLWIEGSGFLYQMVRTITGSLVEVGRGFREPSWMAEVLAARDRRKAGPTAPPHGLCLERVLYGSDE
jgi:tRNA pseudouridine38-40 synthase